MLMLTHQRCLKSMTFYSCTFEVVHFLDLAMPLFVPLCVLYVYLSPTKGSSK